MSRRAGLVAVLVTLAVATPVTAFVPPTLYVRPTLANSIDHSPQGDWLPLSAAPALTWLGGYEIGYTLQAAGTAHERQRVGLAVTAVPDGQPTQPYDAAPYCLSVIGAVGDIVPLSFPLQFEGDGTYAVRVSVGPDGGGPTDCLTPGPATASASGSFSVGAGIDLQVVGQPLLIFRARPSPGDAFVGVRAPAAPGGDAETRCALDATVGSDGAVSGRAMAPAGDEGPTAQIGERSFPQPGAWRCVARGTVEGVDDDFSSMIFGTPWSAPLTLDVRSDFQRVQGRILRARSSRPWVRVTPQFPTATAGGTARLTVRQVVGCRRIGPRRYDVRVRATGTYRARFDARGATFALRRPRVSRLSPTRYYVGTLAFDGTRFITAGIDPAPMLLKVQRTGALSFESPSSFPSCPGFRA